MIRGSTTFFAIAACLSLTLSGCGSEPEASRLNDAADPAILTVKPGLSYEEARAQGSNGPDIAWNGRLKIVDDCLAIDFGGEALMLAVFLEGAEIVSRDGDEVEVRLGGFETLRTGIQYRGGTVHYETRAELEAFTNGIECAERLGVDEGTLIISAEPVS